MNYYICNNEKFIMLFRVYEIKSFDRGLVYWFLVNWYFDVYKMWFLKMLIFDKGLCNI